MQRVASPLQRGNRLAPRKHSATTRVALAAMARDVCIWKRLELLEPPSRTHTAYCDAMRRSATVWGASPNLDALIRCGAAE
jgi:hypothetical protein